jgi:D-mannonate dehydratase
VATWEYKVESVNIADRWTAKGQAQEIANLQARINALGGEGWEMISYESVPMFGSFSSKLKGYAYLLFFKRLRA